MQTLQRVLAVLEALLTSDEPQTATTIEHTTGLPLPTVSRLLHAMVDEGLLQVSPQGAYRPATRLIALANVVISTDDAYARVLSECEQLRDQVAETVSLHRPAGKQRVCFVEVQADHPVRRVVPVGLTVPLHYGAAGACLLADQDSTNLERYFDDAHLPPPQRAAVTSLINEVRESGWTYACDSWSEGLSGLGVPIRADGHTVAVLSVSGPSNRLTPQRMVQAADQARATALRLGRYLASPRSPQR